ncbi:hypothetical protein QYE76_028767 [Lolium multiflorum]|uniref:Leucine-rich repeat-containing N-terminal plant-type domain-containing protein n=1 Tax=Lolium multiflorum TaxID=4521 RepID=A0AAD8QNA7_LOLMU|nr:hypothetical protein QYE76_028767 [Lolium multiflorum]
MAVKSPLGDDSPPGRVPRRSPESRDGIGGGGVWKVFRIVALAIGHVDVAVNDPCKDWLGVSCYQGKVTLLNLPGYGLNGSVSASLGNLSALSDVRLNGNNLTGRVPGSIDGLKSPRELDLSTNDLTCPLALVLQTAR